MPVAALLVDFGAPPAEAAHPPRVEEAEEHDEDAESETGVERGAQRHGILGPPSARAPLDAVVEDVANQHPHGEVEASGGGDPGHGSKDDGEVDLPENALVVLAAAVQPQGNRKDGTERETPD